MCRLFGMISPEPASARFWLLNAPDSVVDQSHRNADGTGLAYYHENLRAEVEKQPIAAHQDQEFASGARHVRSHLFVAHIRHATQGRVSQENTQPFVHEGLVFAHNGNVEGLEDLPFPVGPLYGDTDSERYFALLRHHIQEAPDTLTGIHRTIAWISENRDYTSLNFLLADRDRLYALRSVGNERPLGPAPRSRGGPPGTKLLRHPRGDQSTPGSHALRLRKAGLRLFVGKAGAGYPGHRPS